MAEKIGKVFLDYTYYPGKDLYSDGEIEDELLAIAKQYGEEDYNKIIAERKSWPILYHFSHIRKNIVDFLPINSEDSILEIGSGCGAITGALAEKAGQVTCIELSKKRSSINAYRNRKYENIKILVGNFQDISRNLKEKFDYITLIGVFEYSQGYIQGENPYLAMLKETISHLKPGGKLILAIENRLGLKYWAGCTEDHTGNYFEGLEGYTKEEGVRTFSRPELEKMFSALEGIKTEFYYPYPDYKFPMVIYSDQYLPDKGELGNNICNFDRKRMILFDENKVFDSLCESNLFPLYANSFLVVLEKG